MQNKGFIRVVAVLLTLICLFYLSFSVVTAIYNNKAKEYAAGDEAKYKHYIDSISTEKVYWWYYTYQQCREMEIGLGLDLKGGMNVTLQISVATVSVWSLPIFKNWKRTVLFLSSCRVSKNPSV